MQIEILCFYLFPPPPCFRLSCQCCVWSVVSNVAGNGTLGKDSTSLALSAMQNVEGREEHALDSDHGKQ